MRATKSILFLALAITATSAFAANQFDVLAPIQQATQDREAQEQAQAAADAKARQQAQAKEAARERMAKIEADRAIRMKKAEADKTRADAAVKAAARDEKFEDANRQMDLEERQLRLKAMETRVNRENDVINSELNRSKAETDVVQSQADATRNVSSGAKTYMEDQGKASVKKSEKWFGN